MFFVECDRHENRFVLLDIGCITATRNTPHGVELDWECWCGNRGTWRPHSNAEAA